MVLVCGVSGKDRLFGDLRAKAQYLHCEPEDCTNRQWMHSRRHKHKGKQVQLLNVTTYLYIRQKTL